MDVQTREIYSEVYSVLNLLGESYIKKLPVNLYNMIKEEKEEGYNPKYESVMSFKEQNIKRDSLSMIALFHLNYWCNSEEEKKELEELFKDNEEKYQIEIRKKYNPDDIFKKKKELPIKKIEESSIAILPKEKWYKKLLNIIKNLFKKN